MSKFSFGLPTATTTNAPTFGFNTQTPAAGGFGTTAPSFGAVAPTQAAGAPAATPGLNFSFGGTAPAATAQQPGQQIGLGGTLPAGTSLFQTNTNLAQSAQPSSMFGTGQTGGLFGAAAQTQSAQPGGLSFGTAAQTQPAQPGGLSFGTVAQTQPAQPGGLSFGTATQTQTAQPGGLSFGTAAQTQPAQPGGLSFGTAAQTQPAQPGGLSFGTAAQTQPTQPGGLSFGTAAQTQHAQPGGLSFGTTTPAQTTQPAGLSFGTPAATPATAKPGGFNFSGTPAATTAAAPAAGGLSFGTPATASTGGLSLGGGTTTTSAPGTTGGLSFGATSTAGGLSFGATTTAATSTAPATSNFGFGLTTATTSAPASGTTGGLSFGATSTAGGLSFGGTTTSSSFSFGQTSTATTSASKVPTTTTTHQNRGLGGLDVSVSNKGLAQGSTSPTAAKENLLPNELMQTIDGFKEFVKTQKVLSSDIARGSARPLNRCAEDTASLMEILTTLAGSVQRDRSLADKLKQDTAKALQNAEIAQRTHDTPAGLQYENNAPLLFFIELAENFEHDLMVFKSQIEATEKHIQTMMTPKALTPQELTSAMSKLHESLVAVAGRLQGVHSKVQQQKEQYLNFRKYVLKDSTNVFEDIKSDGKTSKSSIGKITSGPTPFGPGNRSFMSSTALNASQTPNYGTPNALVWGNVTATAPSTNLSMSTSMKPPTTGLSFNPPANLTAPLSSTDPNSSFQLQKPPVGSKRGKH